MGHNSRHISVSREQAALISVLKEGLSAEEDVFKRSRDLLGSTRLTQKLRRTLHSALPELAKQNLIAIEDGEYFLSWSRPDWRPGSGRAADLAEVAPRSKIS